MMYRTIIISKKEQLLTHCWVFCEQLNCLWCAVIGKRKIHQKKNLLRIFGWFQFEFQTEYSASLYAPVLSGNASWCVCVSVCALYYALIITSMKYEYEMLLKFWNYKFYWFSLCSCVYWQMPIRHELPKAFMSQLMTQNGRAYRKLKRLNGAMPLHCESYLN